MAVVSVVSIHPTQGAPADIFGSVSAPVLGADTQKAADLRVGDATVSTQTGSLQYGYPISVPPGRHGAQPHLTLSYSSQSPIYGGVAAGWSLATPEIHEDTTHGRLRSHYWRKELFQTPDDRMADDRFSSTLAGGRRLIKITEPTSAGVWGTYRAQNDGTFTRYERMTAGTSFKWRAYSPDGMTYYFGGASASTCATVSEGYAPLTQTSDAFGNSVTYTYAYVNDECRLSQITYGANANAGISDFNEVDFVYNAVAACRGIFPGSQVDYRSGTKIVTGTSQLATITALARDPANNSVLHTRQITLAYDPNSETNECTKATAVTHSPVRLLTSIQESAWGIDSPRVDLPASTFSYGTPDNRLDTVPSGGTSWGTSTDDTAFNGASLSWGVRYPGADTWPTLRATFIDLDGDGLLDRVWTPTDAGGATCQVTWQHNNGNMTFGSQVTFNLPHLKWANSSTMGANETCALNGQRTQYHNAVGSTKDTYLAYRWMDLDNDGLVDLVAGIYNNPNSYNIDGVGEPQGPLGAWPACTSLSSTWA